MPRRSPLHSRLVALHPVIGFALVLLACAMTAWSLADARDLLRREAEQQAGTVAATLERTIERSATTLDLSLRSAMRGLGIPGLAAMDATTRDLILFDGALTAEGVGDGRPSSRPPPRPNRIACARISPPRQAPAA